MHFETCKSQSNILILILEKPEILQDPNDLEVVFGSTAIFTCKAEGNPEPEIIWMLNANEINQTDSRFIILPDGSLRIDKAIVGDQGEYIRVDNNPRTTNLRIFIFI